MNKEVGKLIVGIAGIGGVVLIAIIAAQLIDQENVLGRINQWPNLKVESLEGSELSTDQLFSDTPVLFNYFNTECVFCQAEIQDIGEHEDLQEAVTLIFISDEDADVIEQFRLNFELEDQPQFQFYSDSNREVKGHYGIRSVPATYLYNTNGELVEFFRGQIKAETLYNLITEMDN